MRDFTFKMSFSIGHAHVTLKQGSRTPSLKGRHPAGFSQTQPHFLLVTWFANENNLYSYDQQNCIYAVWWQICIHLGLVLRHEGPWTRSLVTENLIELGILLFCTQAWLWMTGTRLSEGWMPSGSFSIGGLTGPGPLSRYTANHGPFERVFGAAAFFSTINNIIGHSKHTLTRTQLLANSCTHTGVCICAW